MLPFSKKGAPAQSWRHRHLSTSLSLTATTHSKPKKCVSSVSRQMESACFFVSCISSFCHLLSLAPHGSHNQHVRSSASSLSTLWHNSSLQASSEDICLAGRDGLSALEVCGPVGTALPCCCHLSHRPGCHRLWTWILADCLEIPLGIRQKGL